jgi:Zinc finger, C2H2 type
VKWIGSNQKRVISNNDAKTYKCPDCPQKLSSPEALGRHMRDNHGYGKK